MGKRANAFLVWLLTAVLLTSCGPKGASGGTPGSGAALLTTNTAEPSRAPAACQGHIAFVGQAGAEKDIFVINADGSGLTNVTNGGGPEDAPAWSPDGARILFSRHVGNSDIYTIRPDGSEVVRLTDEPSREYSPAWSPDGQQVIFGSTRGYATEIYSVSAEGGKAIPLTDSAAHKPDFAWSPDRSPGGERIAFTMLDGYNQGDVFVMAAPDEAGAGGSAATNLTQHQAHDCCVAWAPDGERLLFLSSRNDGGARLQSGGPGGVHQSAIYFVQADAGSELAPSSAVVRALTTAVPEQPRDIYVVNSDGSNLTNLTKGAGHAKHAAWSPDRAPGGRQIAYVSDRDGSDDIFVMAVSDTPETGSRVVRLTDGPEDEWHPTWSPDGTCLAFNSYRDGESGLYVLGLDGSGPTKLADNVVWSSSPSWSP